MSRQHSNPVHVLADGSAAKRLIARPLGSGGHNFSEADIQNLVHAHPECLPIAEIDPLFSDPVPICTELRTSAGPIDNFMITATGLPVLVECKLWKNPEGRRLVVGQILDYAKELRRWSSSDVQREVSRRVNLDGNPLLALVRQAGHEIDEVAFNDALTLNLRRGRFLLLIVGDGIREGVEAIAGYLQDHAGLHFTLGLVEMPIFQMADGSHLIAPRVLARTETILRTVISAPADMLVIDGGEDDEDDDGGTLTPSQRESRTEARARRQLSRLAFWTEFLGGLTLDDPEQVIPPPSRAGNIRFKFPSPGNSVWLSVYRSGGSGRVGLFLSGNANSPGETAARMLELDVVDLREELGPSARIAFGTDFPQVSDDIALPDFEDAHARAKAFEWLRARTNSFINALRPRIRTALDQVGA